MNAHRFAPLCVLLAGLCLSNVALAQNTGKREKPVQTQNQAKLKVGSPAPLLSVKSWVKGEPVMKLEPGKAYVVEFWATWCGPCIQSIPHLTGIAEANKNVTFIGMAASERAGSDKQAKEKVEKFVKSQGDKMNYKVALATDGKMNRDWMQAAAQAGIPCAFVVDTKGKIAYIGHPMEDDFKAAVEKLNAEIEKMPKPAEKAKKPEKKPADKKPGDKKPGDAKPGDAKPKDPAPSEPAPEETTPEEPKPEGDPTTPPSNPKPQQ